MPLSDFGSSGDSVSLTKIDGQSFTITFIEDSSYNEGDKSTPGVKITTEESFDISGEKCNKFHTTRIAVVNKLTNEKLRNAINNGGERFPVKCVQERSKTGKTFFNLVDA